MYYKKNENMSYSHKKIILVSHDANRGGAELLLLHTAWYLNTALQYEVIILSKEGGELLKEFQQYAEVYVLNEFSQNEKEYRNLLQSIKNRQFENAICNTIITGDVLAHLTSIGIYCISLIHEMPQVIQAFQALPYGSAIAICSQMIIFPSKIVYQRDLSLISFPDEKVKILPQGLYNNSIPSDRINARKKIFQLYNIAPDEIIVLSVGYGCDIKGFDIFLEIARNITQMRKDIHFIWVGNYDHNHYKIRLKEIHKNGYQKNIHIPGQIKYPELMGIHYSGSDIFVLPSREDSFPSVILEAMSAGLPIVAFDQAGGFQDVLQDDVGILVPYLNIKKMELEIIELADSSKKRTDYKAKSKNRFDTHISHSDYVNTLLSYFPEKNPIHSMDNKIANNLSMLIMKYEGIISHQRQELVKVDNPKIIDIMHMISRSVLIKKRRTLNSIRDCFKVIRT